MEPEQTQEETPEFISNTEVTQIGISMLEEFCVANIKMIGYETTPKNEIVIKLDGENFIKFTTLLGNYKNVGMNKYLFEFYDKFLFKCFVFIAKCNLGTWTLTMQYKDHGENLLLYMKNYNEQRTIDDKNWTIVEFDD